MTATPPPSPLSTTLPTAIALALPISILASAALLYYLFLPAINAARSGGEGAIDEEILDGKSGAADPAPVLSLVVPAYNEEERLPVMMEEALSHLDSNRRDVVERCLRIVGPSGGGGPRGSKSRTFEVLVVDDGSSDGTAEVAREWARRVREWRTGDRVRLIRKGNGGKGSAVRAGMLRSRGELRLMVDADGATEFGYGLERVLGGMESLMEGKGRGGGRIGDDDDEVNGDASSPPPPLASFGSRAHLERKSVAQRSAVRTFLMRAFHFFVKTLCSSAIKDTQCGFKLFTRSAAIPLFANLRLRRWAFDTELVVLSERLGVPIAEVGVRWKEVDGSKLDVGGKLGLALTSLGMLRDMVCVRACYSTGIWEIRR